MDIDDQCWWHGHEPLRPDDYVVCVECGHAFRSREEFERAWAELGAASNENVCPLCAHDF